MQAQFPGMTEKEFAVLMGAHAMGGMHEKNSGYASGGWVPRGDQGLRHQFIQRTTKFEYHWKQVWHYDPHQQKLKPMFQFHNQGGRKNCRNNAEVLSHVQKVWYGIQSARCDSRGMGGCTGEDRCSTPLISANTEKFDLRRKGLAEE